jgi:hypothetical protein
MVAQQRRSTPGFPETKSSVSTELSGGEESIEVGSFEKRWPKPLRLRR